jgi:hypothetical protein
VVTDTVLSLGKAVDGQGWSLYIDEDDGRGALLKQGVDGEADGFTLIEDLWDKEAFSVPFDHGSLAIGNKDGTEMVTLQDLLCSCKSATATFTLEPSAARVGMEISVFQRAHVANSTMYWALPQLYNHMGLVC